MTYTLLKSETHFAASPVYPAHYEVREAIDKRGVTDVALVGYSHGGGTVWLEANLLTNGSHGISKPFSIVFTGFIDAISQKYLVVCRDSWPSGQ